MITILTCTYNREKYLTRLYNSLKIQSSKDFEWIVIDDGSIDNTKEVISSFIEEYKINIKYIFQENKGKHVAINRGVKEAEGDFLFIVDSDDYITNDAVSWINSRVNLISNEKNIAGISGLRANHEYAIIGGSGNMVGEYIECTNLERKKYGLMGDKAEIYKMSLLKKYPFPTFPDEKFIGEEAVWNLIADKGLKVRWYKHIIYFTEYLEDGLTFSCRFQQLEKQNPLGYTYVTKNNIRFYNSLITKSMIFINYKINMNEVITSFKSICRTLEICRWKGFVFCFIGKMGVLYIRVRKVFENG